MTHRKGPMAAATAALLLAASASCAMGDNDVDPATAATSPSASPASRSPKTASVSPASASETAAEDAASLLTQFYEVRNRLRQDPKEPLDTLESVAASTELAAQRNLFQRERSQGFRQTGETLIARSEVQSVNLDNSDPSAGNVPTVQIDVCFDVSDVDLLNEAGDSVVAPDRPDTGWIRYSVANYDWASDPQGGWRVASSQDIERDSCAP